MTGPHTDLFSLFGTASGTKSAFLYPSRYSKCNSAKMIHFLRFIGSASRDYRGKIIPVVAWSGALPLTTPVGLCPNPRTKKDAARLSRHPLLCNTKDIIQKFYSQANRLLNRAFHPLTVFVVILNVTFFVPQYLPFPFTVTEAVPLLTFLS